MQYKKIKIKYAVYFTVQFQCVHCVVYIHLSNKSLTNKRDWLYTNYVKPYIKQMQHQWLVNVNLNWHCVNDVI